MFHFKFFQNKLFNKIAFLPALVMSAVYHEYVLWAPLRFVMPVLLTQFCTFGGKAATGYLASGACHHSPVALFTSVLYV